MNAYLLECSHTRQTKKLHVQLFPSVLPDHKLPVKDYTQPTHRKKTQAGAPTTIRLSKLVSLECAGYQTVKPRGVGGIVYLRPPTTEEKQVRK